MVFPSSEQRKYKTLSRLTFYEPSPFPPSFATPPCGARLGPGGENPGDNVFNEPGFALQKINYLNSIATPDFSWFKRVPVRKYFTRFYLISWETKTHLSGLIIPMENIYLQNQMTGKIVTSFSTRIVYREYFMESTGVRYLRTSCWRIRNRTSKRSERVRFLIQKQRVGKYRTKHFPCSIVFIIYILRHSSFWRPFYFKSFKNVKICRYTLTAKWQRKRSISF